MHSVCTCSIIEASESSDHLIAKIVGPIGGVLLITAVVIIIYSYRRGHISDGAWNRLREWSKGTPAQKASDPPERATAPGKRYSKPGFDNPSYDVKDAASRKVAVKSETSGVETDDGKRAVAISGTGGVSCVTRSPVEFS